VFAGASSIVSFGEDDLIECETDIEADASAGVYVFTAGPECVRDLPRTIRLGVSMSYDDRPDDEEFFDYAFDAAPDDDLSGPIGSSGGPAVSRLAGADRIATAIALSVDRYEDGVASAAVLVQSDDVTDGVVAAPLAVAKGGPLLLTGGSALDPRVGKELERAVEPGSDVLLVGGTGVLSDAIVSDLRARGFRPRRLAGASRFATAVAVADEIGDHAMTIIADGYSPREQLLASAAAASTGGVLVLSNGGNLSNPTDDFVANDAGRHVAIGRSAFASPGAERITGATAAELSQHVLDRLLPGVSTIGVVGPEGIGGSVAAIAHVASLHGGLVMSSRDELSGVIAAELQQRASQLREVVLYGGTGALAPAVESGVSAAVGASSTAGT
jgi:hypothetical protein